MAGTLAAFAISEIGYRVAEFARGTVEASARLQLLRTGLENVTGSSEAAAQRLRELDAVARLPGANLDALIQYNNRLTAIGLTGEEIDSILLNVGQSIVSLGGNANLAEQSLEQISQALQNNIVDLRDFRPIIQRVPGFLQAIADVHGVAPTLDGFREAVKRLGGSVKDALLPVLEELGKRFAAPPPESYVRSIDDLQNAFFLFQAHIGDQFLPVIAQAARELATFFDAIREQNLSELPEPIQEIVRGMQALLDALTTVGRSIGNLLGPPLAYLASNFGSLLGSVLELAAALYTALEPALKVTLFATQVVATALAKLVGDISILIDGITDAVTFLTFWRNEQEKTGTATANLAEKQEQLREATQGVQEAAAGAATAIREAGEAASHASGSTQKLQENLKVLLSELLSVNDQLEKKRQRYQDLIDKGANPAAESMKQLTRQITSLEGQSASLTSGIDKLRGQFLTLENPVKEAEAATHGFIRSIGRFRGCAESI